MDRTLACEAENLGSTPNGCTKKFISIWGFFIPPCPRAGFMLWFRCKVLRSFCQTKEARDVTEKIMVLESHGGSQFIPDSHLFSFKRLGFSRARVE